MLAWPCLSSQSVSHVLGSRGWATLQPAAAGSNPYEGYVPEVPEGVKLDFGSPQFIDYERIGVLQRLHDPLSLDSSLPQPCLQLEEVKFLEGSTSLPMLHACHRSCLQQAAPLGHVTVGVAALCAQHSASTNIWLV